MMSRGRFLLAALVAGCAGDLAAARPDRDAILRQIIACGLTAENATFFVDEEGVANADIAPAGESEAAYRAGVDCLVQWAAQSGAAMGFDVAGRPRP
jgi:hypothetical protein